ncbi:methionine--tRNA ligase [Portibacter lacus]|uniref:Methionine--tRNA ligase n=1 Tax=Portibacter lacus TaxID=1099794 RepID=A0AA37SWL4_9BACT|nr:methionine--tRNA ligase [Portibacter lacus]GLR19218.1 methionine--tRNA ligase [Portibacter lacus]
MNTKKRFLVTSALPYANGPLHIGHLAGAYLSADIYVRFLRMMDKDVVFVCGSDEHGAAITIRAQKDGITPQEVVDRYHEEFKEAFTRIGLSFDKYHRTSAPIHHETSQDFFRTLNNKGEFVKEESEQYYDPKAEQFLADRYIKGTCPKCGYEEAYGDQCENCGSSLSPTELINPISTLSNATPILKKTSHWYLQLDKYEAWLKEWIETGKVDGVELHNPEDWKNHVIGQCKSWLDGGLQKRSMTRDLDWGVDVPQEIEGSEGKKLYVWMDAPIGYISATKQWALDNNKDWEPYWKDEDTALIHFIGKDNIVFHCLIFPAILKAHGEYILPVNVPANQFVNLEGRKISTSKNWAVWVNEYLDDLPGKEDELRYYMIKNMPETKDSEFTWKGYQDAVNNELVNNLANFVNRVVVLTNKYYDGVVPEFDADLMIEVSGEDDEPGFHDSELLELHDKCQDCAEYIRTFDFRSALKTVMEISSRGNQILQFNEPWKLIKEDEETVKVVMNLALQYVSALSVITLPFMPFTSARITELLNVPAIDPASGYLDMLNKLCEDESLIEAGHKIGEASHIFSRMPDDVIDAQIEKLKASEKVEEKVEIATPVKETISFDDFTKLDIRTATIKTAEKVKKADKLLKLTIDLGFEERTVVSGIAQFYKPEELPGKEVSVLVNLAPRKIKGIESNGMILMAEDKEGTLSFVSPKEKWENGSVVR